MNNVLELQKLELKDHAMAAHPISTSSLFSCTESTISFLICGCLRTRGGDALPFNSSRGHRHTRGVAWRLPGTATRPSGRPST